MTKKPQKKWLILTLYTIAIVAWAFVAVIGTEFFIGIIALLIFPNDIFDSTLFSAIYEILSYSIALFLVIWVPPRVFKDKFKKSTRESLGLRGLPTWTDLGLAPIGYVVSIAIAIGLTALFTLLPWFNADEAQDLGYSLYMPGYERALAFVSLAVIAPIAEELFFRGWLYGRLRVKIPKAVAILIVSLLFGIIHLQWNVGISVFAMSVVTCILREVTGTIYAGILVHMLNNGIAFFLVFVAGLQ